MAADLHVHTNASDGTETPAQVVLRAREIGLKAIAITDHDTLDGLVPAMQTGREISLEIIPGVELSTEYKEIEIHILGYLIDIHCREFLERLRQLRMKRKERAIKMVQKLQDLGIPITFEQVLAVSGKAAVGRPHIARALKEEGFVDSLAEAFQRYIGRGCPAYVPRFKFLPGEAVQLIIQAKGIPVFAHPGLAGADEIIPELVRAGLKGLEVYYPAHSAQQVERYLHLCAEYALLPTGGSDYHGPGLKEYGQLAAATVPDRVVQRLKEAGSVSRYSYFGIY
jgi:hypothetical protein